MQCGLAAAGVGACVHACIDALAPLWCRLLPLLLVSWIPRNCELIGRGKRRCAWNFLLSRLTESSNDRTLRGKIVPCRDFISNATYDEKNETSIVSTTFDLRLLDCYAWILNQTRNMFFRCTAKKNSMFHDIAKRKIRLTKIRRKESPIVYVCDSSVRFTEHLSWASRYLYIFIMFSKLSILGCENQNKTHLLADERYFIEVPHTYLSNYLWRTDLFAYFCIYNDISVAFSLRPVINKLMMRNSNFRILR